MLRSLENPNDSAVKAFGSNMSAMCVGRCLNCFLAMLVHLTLLFPFIVMYNAHIFTLR